MKTLRKFGICSSALALCLGAGIMLAGCSGSSEEEIATKTVDYCTTANVDKMDFNYTDRDTSAKYSDNVVNVDLSGNSDADGVSRSNNSVKLTKEATYVLSGELNGQVVVDADDAKVQVVLNGATITNNSGSAIYVKNCNKAFVTLADGTNNTVKDGSTYSGQDDGVDGAIYSKDDLTINGNGTLNVTGNCAHAVVCKDDLLVCGGTLNVKAKTDGLRGKDCVKINGGTINVEAGDDGIAATDSNEDDKGYVSIDGGTLNVNSTGKGIVGQTYVRFAGGSAQVSSTDDTVHCNVRVDVNNGNLTLNSGDDGIHTEDTLNVNGGVVDVQKSYEGLEAEKININGGQSTVKASDDGLNCSSAEWNSVDIAGALGGEMSDELKGQLDKGEKGDDLLRGNTGSELGGGMGGMEPPTDGMGPGSNSSSGQNGQSGIGQNGGIQSQNSQSGMGGMGQNGSTQGQQGQGGMGQGTNSQQQPGSGNSQGQGSQNGMGQGQGGMGDMTPPDGDPGSMGGDSANGGKQGDSANGGLAGALGASGDCKLTINGGSLTVDSYGDGLDSNGDIEINGGTVLVNGPQSGGNAALDYGEQGSAKVNGGTVLLVGSNGMAEDFSGGNQAFNLSNASGSAGNTVQITDASGNVLAQLTATKAFQVVYSSCPSFNTSSKYNVVVNGTTSTTFTPATTSSYKNSGMQGGLGSRGF